METFVLLLFAGCILFFALTGGSVITALLLGCALFTGFGLYRKCSVRGLFQASLQGIYKVRNILMLFLFIGVLTSVWRSSATIPTIIYYSCSLLHPRAVLLLCFLLNCLMSVLTGTSFGTVATTGVITMGIASSLSINPLFAGGAILSGIFFGDRCSPVSTSAILVSEITGTNLYHNIRNMLKTSLVPFLVSCTVYLLLGFAPASGSLETGQLRQLLASQYTLSWLNLLPAALILLLVLLRTDVKWALLSSIVCALILSLAVQGVQPLALLRSLLWGYQASDPEIARLFNGGGLASMFRVMAIVCISSTYSGLFQLTGLLEGITGKIEALSRRTNSFVGVLAASLLTAVISCNQTLTILLSHQLCAQAEKNREDLALYLEDSAVVIAPLVPWSIAGAVPIAALGASPMCLFFACYLYLLPVWGLGRAHYFQKISLRSP